MSYRTVKRALGETNLERKCRILFGVCLALLVAAAFIWVDTRAEKVVLEAARTQGTNAIANELLRRHWEGWLESEKNLIRSVTSGASPDSRIELSRLSLSDFTDDRTFPITVLGLDDLAMVSLESKVPKDPYERKLVQQLFDEWSQRQTEARQAALAERATPADGASAAGTPSDGGSSAGAVASTVSSPVTSPAAASPHAASPDATASDADPAEPPRQFREWPLKERQEYFYYEPISWKNSCRLCHPSLASAGAVPQGGAGVDQPFRVVRVAIPYRNIQKAINQTRAGLIAAAVSTVSLAMLALYVIVRYVIVKPLTHLRDVSLEIIEGNTELRADIKTGDEFEDLADAFNRMLVHLIETQAKLVKTNTTLDTKVDELAQLNMQLYEMNRLKSDFLANMSHELRTPLNSIIGFSEVLQGIPSLNDKQRRYAQNIQKSGRVLLDMINDILDLAKLEAGKMELRPTEFRIDLVVTAQCDMVRSLTETKNIDLIVAVDPAAPPMYQDQGKLQQVLTNLLSNAIKFTPEGGRIEVAARPDALGRLELTVADTGVGIPEEDREIIFEKFRQSKSVLGKDGLTREYSGTGLGLSIVKELCKLLDGEITFASQLGIGSTFKVVLPWVLGQHAAVNLESQHV